MIAEYESHEGRAKPHIRQLGCKASMRSILGAKRLAVHHFQTASKFLSFRQNRIMVRRLS